MEPPCAMCNRPAAQQCAGCHQVAYCNREHQKQHWKGHKKNCKALQLLAAADAGYTRTVIREGEPDSRPQPGQRISVHYTGTLPNGEQFDSSRTRNKPLEFTLGSGQVIRGWDEGLAEMNVGERATLCISADYAYGARGHMPAIPPRCPLFFDVQLLGIVTDSGSDEEEGGDESGGDVEEGGAAAGAAAE